MNIYMRSSSAVGIVWRVFYFDVLAIFFFFQTVEEKFIFAFAAVFIVCGERDDFAIFCQPIPYEITMPYSFLYHNESDDDCADEGRRSQ